MAVWYTRIPNTLCPDSGEGVTAVPPSIYSLTAVTIRLLPEEAKAIKKIASSQGVPAADLIYRWVQERLQTV
ncbi:MAG: hypothetical protein KF770_11570 [Anaerolineae bacterium]|nr:hypothetical protein [Anaerolineae bacterium]